MEQDIKDKMLELASTMLSSFEGPYQQLKKLSEQMSNASYASKFSTDLSSVVSKCAAQANQISLGYQDVLKNITIKADFKTIQNSLPSFDIFANLQEQMQSYSKLLEPLIGNDIGKNLEEAMKTRLEFEDTLKESRYENVLPDLSQLFSRQNNQGVLPVILEKLEELQSDITILKEQIKTLSDKLS